MRICKESLHSDIVRIAVDDEDRTDAEEFEFENEVEVSVETTTQMDYLVSSKMDTIQLLHCKRSYKIDNYWHESAHWPVL